MMKSVLTACLVVTYLSFGLTASTRCDYAGLLKKLKEGKLDLEQYTALYTKCITGTNIDFPSVYGFQPSCSADAPVTQAIVQFENSGTFPANDGRSYPFSVRGVVTFTEIDGGHTRIHAAITGTHNFLFDSNLFSLHVHQKGETNPTCTSTGGHYNPCGKNHSNDPSVEDRHVGDVARVTIPPYFSSDKDVLVFEKIDTQVKLSGPLSVLGRSVTVHGGSKSSRVGCGTIAVTEWEGKDHPATTGILTG